MRRDIPRYRPSVRQCSGSGSAPGRDSAVVDTASHSRSPRSICSVTCVADTEVGDLVLERVHTTKLWRAVDQRGVGEGCECHEVDTVDISGPHLSLECDPIRSINLNRKYDLNLPLRTQIYTQPHALTPTV